MMIPTTPNLTYLGILDSLEMEQWMHRASIFAHPARYEPFGLSILEAALAGCALVLGDIESLRENWDAAALFVPTNDPLEIAKAIEKLTREPKQLQHYQTEARKRGKQLTPEKMALRYLRIYESLAERDAMQNIQKNLTRLSRDERVQ